MNVKKKKDLSSLSQRDEKTLFNILTDPVKWGELFLHNRNGSPRTFWDHQKEDLRCRSKNIIHQDGRDVGKSVCIVTDLLHYAFTTKGGSGLVAAPHQGHLDTLIDEFEFQLSENPDQMSAITINKSGHSAITCKGVRSRIFEEETDFGYDQFMRKTLERFLIGRRNECEL